MQQPGLYKPEYPGEPARQRAFTLYVVNGRSRETVAEDVGVPDERIAQWVDEDDWDSSRRAICLAARTSAGERLGMLMAERAEPLFRQYVDIQSALLNEFNATMSRLQHNRVAARANGVAPEEQPVLHPKELASLARALNSAFGTGRSMLEAAGVLSSDGEGEKSRAQAPVQVHILNAVRDATTEFADPVTLARPVNQEV